LTSVPASDRLERIDEDVVPVHGRCEAPSSPNDGSTVGVWPSGLANGRLGPHGDPVKKRATDVYFSADVETDGAIPGPRSMLSFALVVAGRYDGERFERPERYDRTFEVELRPISNEFDPEALRINGLDRDRLLREGTPPKQAMNAAAAWVRKHAGDGVPVLVAYPLSFDWTWLYWYFESFADGGSPFRHSRCFDLKTAFAVKSGRPVSDASRESLPRELRSSRPHTHRALDDAIEQAEIFANIFEWQGR
jgi:hypothetical protein